MALLLEGIYNQSRNLESDINTAAFEVSPTAIVVNFMFFIGLVCSLLAGLGGLLVKQWARQSASEAGRPKPTRDAARYHYENWAGLSFWRMRLIIATIPMLLHVALLLFYIGILWWLLQANVVVFGVILYPH